MPALLPDPHSLLAVYSATSTIIAKLHVAGEGDRQSSAKNWS